MRIVKDIVIEGKTLHALFDTGSFNSYVRAAFRPSTTRPAVPVVVGLGGEARRLTELCSVTTGIDGLEFDMTAYIVNELGETEAGRIDAVVGALTMEQWWIKLDPRTGELDLSKLRDREFQEF